MPPPSYLSPYTEARCSAVVSETSDEVRAVVLEWARDLGWKPVTRGSSFLTFKLGRAIFSSSIEMEVSRYPSRGATEVQFLGRAGRSPDSDWNRDMERAVETFAHGVLYELRLRGSTVHPPRLTTARRSRKWLRAGEQVRRPVEWALAALFVPLTVMVWFLTKNPFWTLAIYGWFVGAILMAQFSRFWANGIHARLQVVAVLILVGMALGATIAGASV